jgi:hypothetical protein
MTQQGLYLCGLCTPHSSNAKGAVLAPSWGVIFVDAAAEA